MAYSVVAAEPFAAGKFSMRCPTCRKVGIFTQPTSQNTDISWEQISTSRTYTTKMFAGARICPNGSCSELVFFVSTATTLECTYPAETIDFDASDLPKGIVETLREAVLCEAAGAHRAAALMVRRVLEELCEDRGAKGPNLQARIEALGRQIVVPQDLLAAAHDLRLLGNDAAHIEAKTYDRIDKAETAVALELAKELLKATYQYGSLVAKLRALKSKPPESEEPA